MIKAAFLDIDGTLVSFNTHRIPDSALAALKKAREQGMKLFIATGRPRQFLNAASQIEPMIDGYITCNGACCTMGDTVLFQKTLQKEQVAAIVETCQSKRTTCIVIGLQNVMIINDTPELQHIFCEMLRIDVNKYPISSQIPIINVQDSPLDDIVQVIPFVTSEEEKALMPQLPDCAVARWHPAFVDITRSGTDKGRALQQAAEAIGIDITETIAFGDGGNDISMLRAAGIGVAMGNADDNVKQHADYITTSVDEDGIAAALAHFNVFRLSWG